MRAEIHVLVPIDFKEDSREFAKLTFRTNFPEIEVIGIHRSLGGPYGQTLHNIGFDIEVGGVSNEDELWGVLTKLRGHRLVDSVALPGYCYCYSDKGP